MRIIIANVYETLGVSAERLISREARGNLVLVVETWVGPTQEQHTLTTFGVAGKKAT